MECGAQARPRIRVLRIPCRGLLARCAGGPVPPRTDLEQAFPTPDPRKVGLQLDDAAKRRNRAVEVSRRLPNPRDLDRDTHDTPESLQKARSLGREGRMAERLEREELPHPRRRAGTPCHPPFERG